MRILTPRTPVLVKSVLDRLLREKDKPQHRVNWQVRGPEAITVRIRGARSLGAEGCSL